MRTESEFLVYVLGRLNQARIDYMLTGSMASNYWGIPRTTHLDFVLLMYLDQVDGLVACFEKGLFVQPESVRSAFWPPYQFNVLGEQSASKADFWLLQDNSFEQSGTQGMRSWQTAKAIGIAEAHESVRASVRVAGLERDSRIPKCPAKQDRRPRVGFQ